MRKIRYLVKKAMSCMGMRRFFYQIDSTIQLIANSPMRKALKTNKKFHNIHRGKRCFIIGNGPSLNTQDLTKLSGEIVFTVNQAARNPMYQCINSTYHLWTDRRFFNYNSTDEKEEMLSVIRATKNANSEQTVFYAYGLRKYVEEYGLDKLTNVAYIGEDYLYSMQDLRKIDLTRCIPGFSTVIHYAILIAIYMGFSEIYLLGCDCTGFITTAEAKMKTLDSSNPYYGYPVSENEKKRLEKVNSAFSMEEELSFYVNIFKTYRLLNGLAIKNGIQLINLTRGGVLECLHREEYETVVKRNAVK